MFDDLAKLDLLAWVGWAQAVLVTHGTAMVSVAVLALAFLLIVAIVRARSARTAEHFAELKGRLTAMTEMTAQRHTEQARVQESRFDTVSARLAESLEALSRRLGDTVAQSDRHTGDAAARLNDRIDALSRHLAQNLETVTARLGDTLTTSSQQTSNTLASLNERLALIDQARQGLADLSNEVGSLHGVLADKQARGAFGQARMEAIIADALPPNAYDFQATLSNGRRPDCLVRLPNAAARLVIDSKFPLEGFEALRAARNPDDTRSASRAIREAVGRHIEDIAEKYLITGETQDTALMFVPSESIYADVHEHFTDLVQKAHRARIALVSPNILMLAVQTMQAVIKDVRMRDQAGAIQKEVGLLLGDVARLVARVEELERHFSLSAKALEAVSTSAGKINARGERLQSLDLADDSEADAGAAAKQVA